MVTEANIIFDGSRLYQNMALIYMIIILLNCTLFKTIRIEWELLNVHNSFQDKLKFETDLTKEDVSGFLH